MGPMQISLCCSSAGEACVNDADRQDTAGRGCPPAQITGQITYNGHTLDEFVPQRTAAYISQARAVPKNTPLMHCCTRMKHGLVFGTAIDFPVHMLHTCADACCFPLPGGRSHWGDDRARDAGLQRARAGCWLQGRYAGLFVDASGVGILHASVPACISLIGAADRSPRT